MSPRRGDRAAAPPISSEWDVRFGSNTAASGWDELCSSAPTNTRHCFEAIRSAPTPVPHTTRQHRLKGEYKDRDFGGRTLPQWQYEVTSGGRVWYLVDDAKHIIWITYAGTGHPRATG